MQNTLKHYGKNFLEVFLMRRSRLLKRFPAAFGVFWTGVKTLKSELWLVGLNVFLKIVVCLERRNRELILIPIILYVTLA